MEDASCPISAGAEATPFKEPFEVVYRRWLRKKKQLEEAGYTVVVQWECQHNREKETNPELRAFLEEQYKKRPKEQLALRKGLRGRFQPLQEEEDL